MNKEDIKVIEVDDNENIDVIEVDDNESINNIALNNLLKGEPGKDGEPGTTNYNEQENKPKINGVELVDNKTSEELGLQPKGDYAMKETTDSIRADLGSNFGEIQEDLYYKLVNNKENGRFNGTVGSKLSNVTVSAFTRFRIPVEENEFYTIKYRSTSTNTKLIHIVDENDIVIQVVDNDIEYTAISMNEISCLIPKNAKYLCISTYCNSINFNNNPREYAGLKTIKKEVVKNMLDSLYGKTGKFKTLDLSDYSQNASTGGMNPLTDLTEDGVYQVRGKGYINFGNDIYDYSPGDIIFRSYDGEVVSFISGTYGAGLFSYDSSEEAYIGGYYTSIADVIYEIERLAKKSMNATTTALTNQMASPNYEYRRLSETGSTAIRLTLGAALKNLTISDREEFSLFFKTHATTPCTWTWYTSTVPVKYHGDSVVDGKFVPELNTWYKIDARWEGKFWLLNIIGIKGN